MAEAYQKKELLALMATGANKLCIDCNAPSPQWASVSYGTFICLECSGVHRSFGVHISFIRSITMDKWSNDQAKKMKVGGNEKFTTFMNTYGPEGGYTKGMGMKEKYHSWAAAQYREKLTAECADPPQSWTPSSPPADFGVPSRPVSAQATRKSRAGAGGGGIGSSLNPSNQPSRSSTPGGGNEAFFERMGNANSSRPDNLPPSQGGKYAGFGSTPDPPAGSYAPYSGGGGDHPSYGMSSHSVPTLTELQSNPLGALSKGWGLFSSAVRSSAEEINRSVVQPGVARASDLAHNLQDQRRGTGNGGAGNTYSQRGYTDAYTDEDDVDPLASAATNTSARGGYGGAGAGAGAGAGESEWEKYLKSGLEGARAATTWAGQRANEGWSAANEIAKAKGGIDLNQQMGKLGLGGGGGAGGRGEGEGTGYGRLDKAEGGVISPPGQREDDFFDSWDDQPKGKASAGTGGGVGVGAGKTGQTNAKSAGDKKGWDDDEWKDF